MAEERRKLTIEEFENLLVDVPWEEESGYDIDSWETCEMAQWSWCGNTYEAEIGFGSGWVTWTYKDLTMTFIQLIEFNATDGEIHLDNNWTVETNFDVVDEDGDIPICWSILGAMAEHYPDEPRVDYSPLFKDYGRDYD